MLVFPVWNFGYPAILKGFFDRVFLPGVSFKLDDGKVRPALHNIRKLAAVVTYGGSRFRDRPDGRPAAPHVQARAAAARSSPARRPRYLALYDMNRATERPRAFLARARSMRHLACRQRRADADGSFLGGIAEIGNCHHQPDMLFRLDG